MYEGGGLILCCMEGSIRPVANELIAVTFKNWAKSLSSSRFCLLRRSDRTKNASEINATAPPTEAPIIVLYTLAAGLEEQKTWPMLRTHGIGFSLDLREDRFGTLAEDVTISCATAAPELELRMAGDCVTEGMVGNFDDALEVGYRKVCDAPSFDFAEEFDEISAVVEVDSTGVGDTDIAVIEVANDSLLAKLEDNKEIEGINELEIVSVVAVANRSWERTVYIEVDGSVDSPGIMDDDENAGKPMAADGLPCKLDETKAIELNTDSNREC
ncbi:hypothetical protein B0H14DRAFT_2569306 [Mycena olivaceomarginata]|nr:hypothetical protein B0H14DRAFT_2569306 [Mycena olivaceomarginata]